MTPRFRPDAPAPMATPSTRTTRAPRSAMIAAAAHPMMPAAEHDDICGEAGGGVHAREDIGLSSFDWPRAS